MHPYFLPLDLLDRSEPFFGLSSIHCLQIVCKQMNVGVGESCHRISR